MQCGTMCSLKLKALDEELLLCVQISETTCALLEAIATKKTCRCYCHAIGLTESYSSKPIPGLPAKQLFRKYMNGCKNHAYGKVLLLLASGITCRYIEPTESVTSIAWILRMLRHALEIFTKCIDPVIRIKLGINSFRVQRLEHR